MYYLQSRYYDPEVCRFINADDYASTGYDFAGYNMFSYCNNNPAIFCDDAGKAVETIFDVITLGFSIAEVIANPSDPWAWVGLAGDVIDLIPCVTGVGELVRGVKAVSATVDVIDDVVDGSKAVKKLHRPYIRKSTREAVENAAMKAPDGRFLDANTGLPIDGKYDLGHTYGHEFWRERNKAMELGWTQKQFNDYMNNPTFYRIESPITNRSHKFEMRM